MKSFATNHNDPNAKLGWVERLGYGSGQFGINLINAILGSFLTIYFTNVTVLNIAVISSIIAVSKIFDGVSDIIMGDLVDKTDTTLGKARVWLLRMCIPFAVSTILLFYVPQSFPVMVQYVYVFILYNMVNAVFFTSMFVPYASMTYLITANSFERGLLGNITQIFSTLANVIINAVFLKLLAYFGGGKETMYTQRAFTGTMTLICAVMLLMSLICVITTKERVTASASKPGKEPGKPEEKIKTMDAIKALLKNQYWIILTFCMFTVFFVVVMFSVAAIFYTQYVLGNADLFPLLSNSVSIAQFGIMFITPLLMKKFGRRKVYTAGIGVVLAGFIGFIFAGGNMPLMIICNVLKGIGMGAAGGMSLGMVTDTIDYGMKKTGIPVAGMGNAGISAAQKLGLGLGTAVMGWVLDAGGFDGQASVQPESALTAINICYTWIPIILMAVTFVLMLFFYKLDGKAEEKIM